MGFLRGKHRGFAIRAHLGGLSEGGQTNQQAALSARRTDALACSTIALLDMLTTFFVLYFNKGFERNQLLGTLIAHIGLPALVLYAPIEALLIYLVLRLLLRLRLWLGLKFRAEYTFLALLLYAPVNNLLLLSH
jgi:hypothetical protein